MTNQDNQPYLIIPAPTSSYQTTGLDYPGKNMAIVAMVLSLVSLIGIPTALIGLILGYVAYTQSKRAGFKNSFALVAIIVGWIVVAIVTAIIGLIVLLGLIFS